MTALALNGPKARDILSQCSPADLGDTAFPWLSSQEITVAVIRFGLCGYPTRVSVGWELHMPNAAALAVYQALSQAGAAYDMVDYGSFAMNVMRMEKGYPARGS